jgi:hypothetical protein
MPADVTELVAALDDYQGQPWTADRVHLVRSRLGATEQPRYTSLANWPLRAPPATEPATGPATEPTTGPTAGGPVTTTG